MPALKAKAKARKARKARTDLLPLKLKKEDDRLPRKLRKKAEDDSSQLTSLLASDGLKALALTRIVGIGIPRLVVTSRQETS